MSTKTIANQAYRLNPAQVYAWQYTQDFASLASYLDGNFDTVSDLPEWLDDVLSAGRVVWRDGALYLTDPNVLDEAESMVEVGEWLFMEADTDYYPTIDVMSNDDFTKAFSKIEDKEEAVLAKFGDGSAVLLKDYSGGDHPDGLFGAIELRFIEPGFEDQIVEYRQVSKQAAHPSEVVFPAISI